MTDRSPLADPKDIEAVERLIEFFEKRLRLDKGKEKEKAKAKEEAVLKQ